VIDGNLSEWNIVPEKYVLTTDDFQYMGDQPIDLADFAILRVVIGWSDARNRLYFAIQIHDDTLRLERQRDDEILGDDGVIIYLDADHSGGRYRNWDYEFAERETEWYHARRGTQATYYFLSIHPSPPPENLSPLVVDNFGKWVRYSPYTEVAWQATTNSLEGGYDISYELAIIPFDSLKWQGPDVSKFHDLQTGEVLGLDCMLQDVDGWHSDGVWTLTTDGRIFTYSDAFSDFMLASVDEKVFGLAVGKRTWGWMKARRGQDDLKERR